MAKDTKQPSENQINNEQEITDYFKKEKLSPEREKGLLAEFKRAIRYFKEIEARNKRGEKYQIKLKGFKELNVLNNKYIKTDAYEQKADEEKDAISMEMAWAQVDGKVWVTFDEMAAFLRPARRKEFFGKLRYDTQLKRDLVGMTEVIKHIKNREFSKAQAAMIYFNVKDRMQMMEEFFEVFIPADFKKQIEETYKFAQEQGLNEFQMKNAASDNMRFSNNFINTSKAAMVSAITGENVDSFHIAVAKSSSVSDIIKSINLDFEVKLMTKPLDDHERRKSNSDYYLIKKDYMPGLLLQINKLDITILMLKSDLDEAIKSGNITKQQEIKQKLEIAEETKNKFQTRYDMFKKLPSYAYHETAETIREIKALEDRRNKLASDPSKAAEVLRLDKEIEEKYNKLDRILTGKEKVPKNTKLDPILDVRENKKAIKVEERDLKEQLYTETDPKKRKIIEAQLAAAKAKKLELQAQDLKTQGADAVAGQIRKREEQVQGEDKVVRMLNELSSPSSDSTETESDDVTHKPKVRDFESTVDEVEHTIRSTYDQADFEEILAEIGRGETNPEKLEALEKLKARLSSSYIESFKNKRTLDEYISTFNSIDESNPEGKKEKQHIAQVVVQIIYERLDKFKYNISENELTNLEVYLNEVEPFYKKQNGGVELGKLKILIAKKKEAYANKHENLSETNKSFNEVSTNSNIDNCIDFIKAYYDKVNALKGGDIANYTEEEITALESGFNYCESIIAEKNLKGNENFESARENARKKVSEIRVRHKVFGILDTTELYSIKDRDKQIEKLRENLKFLCECIDAGTLDPHNINQIAHLNVEYRKLKALLMTNDEKLDDIEKMLGIVAGWEYKTEQNNKTFNDKLMKDINSVKNILSKAIEVINKPNLDKDDIKLLIDCSEAMKKLKSQYTVDREFYKEIDELYEKIKPKIKEVMKIQYEAEASELLEDLKRFDEIEFDGKTIGKFKDLEKRINELKKKCKNFIDPNTLFLIDIKLKSCQAKVERYNASNKNSNNNNSEKNNSGTREVSETRQEPSQESEASLEPESENNNQSEKVGRYTLAGEADPDATILEAEASPLPEPEGQTAALENNLTKEELAAISAQKK